MSHATLIDESYHNFIVIPNPSRSYICNEWCHAYRRVMSQSQCDTESLIELLSEENMKHSFHAQIEGRFIKGCPQRKGHHSEINGCHRERHCHWKTMQDGNDRVPNPDLKFRLAWKWGRAQIVTTQKQIELRFQYWSSIRMIAPPECQGQLIMTTFRLAGILRMNDTQIKHTFHIMGHFVTKTTNVHRVGGTHLHDLKLAQ